MHNSSVAPESVLMGSVSAAIEQLDKNHFQEMEMLFESIPSFFGLHPDRARPPRILTGGLLPEKPTKNFLKWSCIEAALLGEVQQIEAEKTRLAWSFESSMPVSEVSLYWLPRKNSFKQRAKFAVTGIDQSGHSFAVEDLKILDSTKSGERGGKISLSWELKSFKKIHIRVESLEGAFLGQWFFNPNVFEVVKSCSRIPLGNLERRPWQKIPFPPFLTDFPQTLIGEDEWQHDYLFSVEMAPIISKKLHPPERCWMAWVSLVKNEFIFPFAHEIPATDNLPIQLRMENVAVMPSAEELQQFINSMPGAILFSSETQRENHNDFLKSVYELLLQTKKSSCNGSIYEA